MEANASKEKQNASTRPHTYVETDSRTRRQQPIGHCRDSATAAATAPGCKEGPQGPSC